MSSQRWYIVGSTASAWLTEHPLWTMCHWSTAFWCYLQFIFLITWPLSHFIATCPSHPRLVPIIAKTVVHHRYGLSHHYSAYSHHKQSAPQPPYTCPVSIIWPQQREKKCDVTNSISVQCKQEWFLVRFACYWVNKRHVYQLFILKYVHSCLKPPFTPYIILFRCVCISLQPRVLTPLFATTSDMWVHGKFATFVP